MNKVSLIFNDTTSILITQDNNDNYGGNNNGFFLKNKIENKSYTTMRFMNVTFNVWDSLYNFKWELLSDTMNILGQRCLAAKTDFRGRTYIAYYSTNYSTTEGPWKFGGLPGLILDVKSTDNYIEYKAVKIIENYTGKVSIPNLNKFKFLDWNSFVTDYKKTVDKYIKLVKSNENYPNGGSVVLKIESTEIFYPELQTNKGIEF
ncbi:MAG: GLPGLI family protein [Agriterribacter sp.]